MINITLSDGSIKSFEHEITVFDLAKRISTSLAKKAVCSYVNDKLTDLSYLLSSDSTVKILTGADIEALEVIRHSTAHLLAHAVKRLYPNVQVTIGPVIENGFYYDFYGKVFTDADLAVIENKMHEIANDKLTINRMIVSKKEAIDFFKNIKETYKVNIINEFDNNQEISLYQQDDFTDLCRGPHVAHTGFLKYFKLLKVAGSYWRGDANNEMLQRIYGTAWFSQEDLDKYLLLLDESKKRDHRKINKQMSLFSIHNEAPGMIFWEPSGWIIWQLIEQYIRSMYQKYNYQEIRTPALVDSALWHKSGHLDKFSDDMFLLKHDCIDYALKPMNCPCHVLYLKNTGIISYRELPIRVAEFGSCFRNEASGALHGLFRTRNFTQDDGHIFCLPDQICDEILTFIDMFFETYKHFGLKDISINISTRPVKRIGSDEVWDQAEAALEEALKLKGLKWDVLVGDGAFYGPKIEFIVHDCLGRSWTTGTVQLDFFMPQRLELQYITSNSTKEYPVMLHRAICGSMERFIGILIEHYSGHMPLWLLPIQCVVLTISDKFIPYAKSIVEYFLEHNIRTKYDYSAEKIGYKIRNFTLLKVRYLIIIGSNELDNNTVSVRHIGDNLGEMNIQTFFELYDKELNML